MWMAMRQQMALAKQGALAHASARDAGHYASDAKRIARIVQKMQAHIWELFVHSADEDSKAADKVDSGHCAHAQEPVLHDFETDYD